MSADYERLVQIHQMLDPGGRSEKSIEELIAEKMAERTSEAEYGRLVAVGLLRPAKTALIDARDLLESVEHPAGVLLRSALMVVATVEKDLMEEGIEDAKP